MLLSVLNIVISIRLSDTDLEQVQLLQASVSIKRLSAFLQNKDLDEGNVLQYPQSEETGKLSVDLLHYKHHNFSTTLSIIDVNKITITNKQ